MAAMTMTWMTSLMMTASASFNIPVLAHSSVHVCCLAAESEGRDGADNKQLLWHLPASISLILCICAGTLA
jgi:hypothetical protein